MYSFCMGASGAARLSNQPPSCLIEHLKPWEQKGGLLIERARELWKLKFDIAETEHSFNTVGFVKTYV